MKQSTKLKKLQRFDINSLEFMDEKLVPKDFKGSCIILDDIELTSDKKLKNKILNNFCK
jgi:hypothetical protein